MSSTPMPPAPPAPPAFPLAEAPASPTPRRLVPARWLDLRLVLGVVLVLGSVLLGAKVVANARHTYPRVALRADLAAGAIVGSGDLRVEQVQLPGTRVYLSRIEDAVGRRLARAVGRGELLPASALESAPPQTSVTVPLATGSSPALHRGQRIELWVSTPHCASVVLLPDVTVQAVHVDGAGSFGASGNGQNVVISVPPADAQRVVTALALDNVELRAGVLGGASAAATPLGDLATCTVRA